MQLQSLVFPVTDLGRAVDFFQGLEFKLIGRFDEDGVAFIGVGGAQLWLVVTDRRVVRPVLTRGHVAL